MKILRMELGGRGEGWYGGKGCTRKMDYCRPFFFSRGAPNVPNTKDLGLCFYLSLIFFIPCIHVCVYSVGIGDVG